MAYYDPAFYAGKRVFVTGHTGFKGSWLCKMLVMAGAPKQEAPQMTLDEAVSLARERMAQGCSAAAAAKEAAARSPYSKSEIYRRCTE